MNDAESAVTQGAAWLDATCPDWVERVDLFDLDMGNYERCVYGQVFGENSAYEHFSEFGPEKWNQDNGFDESFGISFADLASAWRSLIEERRSDCRSQEAAELAARILNTKKTTW